MNLMPLLVLAAVAVFLVLKLRSVLGTRTGFEPKPDNLPRPPMRGPAPDTGFEVIEGDGKDRDIADHVDLDSDAGQALIQMKRVEPDFSVTEFMSGSKQAYEMILMAYENGDLKTLEQFLAPDVYRGFEEAVEQRAEAGLTVEARFVGVREVKLKDARFDDMDNVADIVVRFVGELTSVVRNAEGQVVEGDPQAIKRQSDVWTFSRVMGSENPNWLLVATGA
ncbi:Tim44/TimA family putative adaptor protein [Pontivivens nitratireducens]|uniref:Tim44/TimA family putative adaptor protein n=1 Tax=Pontivivens nitratireducens TaxID=2758038 RepID=UPI00163B2707|nr:Tim44/TimA family putative adaptor protein [Pontibrevibacter nitratireducens]